MKKFMNSAATMVAEGLSGFVLAHGDTLAFGPERKYICRRTLTPGKATVISGGGAGHEPMHTGFVGLGMLDAACTGHIFTSPTPDQIHAAIDGTDMGAGCLLVVKNYDGDVMNFEMASEMALAAGGRKIATVRVNDDVAVDDSMFTTGRRGVAGTIVVEKVIGAAAEAGAPLETLETLGHHVNGRTRTMGVALTGATVPHTARTTFVLSPDEMEVGVGIHGEPGRSRDRLRSANEIAALICGTLLDDLKPAPGASLLLFVNGFGGTPLSELYLVYNAAAAFLAKHNAGISRSLVGTYATSLDMCGLSITLTVLDETIARWWDAPVCTPALRWKA